MHRKLPLKAALLATLSLTAGSNVMAEQAHSQIHYSADSQKSFAGPPDLFTGDVQVEIVFPSNEVAHYSGAYVTFAPGARTAWHLHPAGQHMIITDGTALTGTRNGEVIRFQEGEAVWCPPELDHWHAATPDAPMTHFVVTASKDGENVIWKEPVTDEHYEAAVAASE
ncbi:cupin domain-containing protein [Marinobacter pelagius]|uniref:(R)-mandelonitrile lyase n=1 Tax=Marinobacter sp. C7 TaxID=2951363 RepID=UPI001EF07E38|nr:cupin domain-containing protein [Marinobacter sp. C7]MCG7201516.1 cupin domain-containing protein [Marinobacter sp. C7]